MVGIAHTPISEEVYERVEHEARVQHLGLFKFSDLGPGLPMEETIRRVARIGYDGIEIGRQRPTPIRPI